MAFFAKRVFLLILMILNTEEGITPKLPISASYGSQIPNSPNPIIKDKRLGIDFENKIEGVSEVGILDKLPMV